LEISVMMDPLYRNLLVAVGTIVYVKVVVGFCDICVSNNIMAPRISRKCIHMAAGAWIIWWPLFSQDHWTWRLNILVPSIYTVQLFVKGCIIKNSDDVDVQTMTRTGDPKELLNGPIFFTLLMNLVGVFFFRQKIGVIVMACLGFGDGVAPLVGYYLPFGSYPTWPFGPNDRKTLSGSLAFVVASVLGYYLMRIVVNIEENDDGSSALVDDDNLRVILQVATIAAVTEGICGPYDNPCIAMSAGLSYYCLTNTKL
jgi:phytol kinase